MLRTDKKAGFIAEGAWFWKAYRFQAAQIAAARPLRPRVLRDLERVQRAQPVELIEAQGRRWWWFRDSFYWEDERLTAQDVLARLDAAWSREGHRVYLRFGHAF